MRLSKDSSVLAPGPVPMFSVLFVALFSIVGVGKLAAADPSEAEILRSMPSQVGIFVESLTAEQKLVEALLYQYRAESNDQALREKLQSLVGAGVNVTEMGYVVTRSGSPAAIESIVERVYPTEFDPPEITQELRGPIVKGNAITSPATPTVFQTRNTGLTVRVTPQVGPDRKRIDLDISINGVEFAGDDVQGKGLSAIKMPRFHSRDATVSVIASSGEDVLLGVFSPSEGSTLRELIFVRATELPLASLAEALRQWKNRAEANGNPAPGAPKDGEADPFAEKAPATQPTNVVTLVEYLEVPASEVHRRLRAPMPSADATTVRQSLEGMIQAGKIKRTAVNYVPTRSGRRAKTRSGSERIYGVEADPPEIPGKLQGPIDPSVVLITPLHRTTFEMRPEGVTVEADPQLGPDGQTIDLSIAPERVKLIGSTRYGQQESEMSLPLFHAERVATSVSLLSGRYILLGAHSNRSISGQNTGTYTLVFVTATVKGG